ncbi:MAG: S9 family peptidase [Bacteroidales bacterium]|nr:S9 family peptidase [Bacteroidales bacterium]
MKSLATILLFFVSSFIIAQNVSLEDVWVTYKYYPASLDDIRSMSNGESYTINENGESIVQYSFKTGKTIKTLFSLNNISSAIKPSKIESYDFSDDEKSILIASEKERIYRHSSINKYYIYNIQNKELKLINENKVQEATLSPSGQKVAYVFKNNLYIKDLQINSETAITIDGQKNKIINGIPDWVYEEEFSFSKAFEWSPDDNYIAYLKFDESQVKEFSIPMYKGLYPEEYKYKYPKAGEKNSLISLHIYQVKNQKNIVVQLENDSDFYIPRIYWTKIPNTLMALKLNRLQNTMKLFLINAENGQSQCIYTEQNNTYIELPEIIFAKDGKSFFITSDKDGFNHIYQYDINGKLLKQVTSGKWDVTQLNGYDDVKQIVYYTSAETSPMQRNVYSINIKTGEKKRLTLNDGTNEAIFNSTFTYFINEFSNTETPSIYTLCDNTGKTIRVLEDNGALKSKLQLANLSKKEFIVLKTSEGIELNAWILKPQKMEANKKYPVMFCIYGGPGSQEVLDKWDYNALWYQHLASQGVIVVAVDNRGTGARGAEFRKCTYKNLGKYEAIDQIEAAKALSKLSYIDSTRIGIWGWSFGGYLSTLCLEKGSQQFKLAIAVAPVTNWRYYDSIYTERYNGLPQDNATGYDDNSPINHTKKIKGKYLLIHGTADDNVHFQNSVELIKKLVENNKDFQTMYYPNSNHGIYTGKNTRYHLFSKMTKFILENL